MKRSTQVLAPLAVSLILVNQDRPPVRSFHVDASQSSCLWMPWDPDITFSVSSGQRISDHFWDAPGGFKLLNRSLNIRNYFDWLIKIFNFNTTAVSTRLNSPNRSLEVSAMSTQDQADGSRWSSTRTLFSFRPIFCVPHNISRLYVDSCLKPVSPQGKTEGVETDNS